MACTTRSRGSRSTAASRRRSRSSTTARCAAGSTSRTTCSLTREASLSGVHRADGAVRRRQDGARGPLRSRRPPPVTHVEMEDVGPDHMHVALVRPHGYVPGARYPLIDSAYGGPHAQVVALDDRGMLFEQWMADATGRHRLLRRREGYAGPRARLGARAGRQARRRAARRARAGREGAGRAHPGRLTVRAWASTAGRSADTSPRSPSCGGPTCSRRRSPSPR